MEDKDHEHFITVSLDTKNQPTSINITREHKEDALILPRKFFTAALLQNEYELLKHTLNIIQVEVEKVFELYEEGLIEKEVIFKMVSEVMEIVVSIYKNLL
ncbi:hypothetical protein [Bacillus mycoides]|uniref:hypothetical protein n=1 Tax=Bacillus mycoides TaxID=1405 RepID=UPI002DF9BABF|nr:hypothetical protein [Bacillus mycoides]MEC5262845.1 hypothetical protein [Bacillus mycoides]